MFEFLDCPSVLPIGTVIRREYVAGTWQQERAGDLVTDSMAGMEKLRLSHRTDVAVAT